MLTLRRCVALLLLSLVGAGCASGPSGDPLGLENPSLLSRLVPRTGGRTPSLAGRGRSAAGGDPFIQPAPQTDRNPPGRALVSDAFGEDREEAAAPAAVPQSAQPLGRANADVVAVGTGPRQEGAVQQAAVFGTPSTGASPDEADMRQRLQELEWELQFTEDHAAQDQLALEIARLRKQLARNRR